MAVNYAYNYVEIDDATGLCLGVVTDSRDDLAGTTSAGTTYYMVEVYDPEFLLKYYINGSWYEDAEGTIPWTSSLL